MVQVKPVVVDSVGFKIGARTAISAACSAGRPRRKDRARDAKPGMAAFMIRRARRILRSAAVSAAAKSAGPVAQECPNSRRWRTLLRRRTGALPKFAQTRLFTLLFLICLNPPIC